MKLIVGGATGYVATEVIRQSLRLPSITSIVALARRPVSTPPNLYPGSDASKLKSVVITDFSSYSEAEKSELAGADACIWTLAITPTKSRSMEWAEVKRICHDYAFTGLKTIYEMRNQSSDKQPFRYLYMSGSAAERDQTKPPRFMPEYCLMRGEVENQVLAFVAEHKGEIEATVVKPGMIKEPGVTMKGVVGSALNMIGVVPNITVTEVSAAMLSQVIQGFEKDPLMNDDLVRLGQQALKQFEK